MKGLGSQNPKRPLIAPTCNSGPADACTFNTVISVRVDGLEYSVRDIDCLRAGAGFTSSDGRRSNRLPARSDGLNNVDGGPDAAFYIEIGII